MGTFHILADVIFLRRYIYRLKSAMRKNMFSYSKTGPAPVWLDSENYSSTFCLVTLGKEIGFGRKYEEQECILIPKKITICGIERMWVYSSLLKLRNEIMRIYL